MLCHLPQYEYGSWVPNPGYEAKPSTRVMGSRDQYEYWARWRSFWQNILNLYYSTDSWKLFWYPLLGIQYQRETVCVAGESGNLWPWALHAAATSTTTNTSAYYTRKPIGNKTWIQQVLLRLSSSFSIKYTCYQYTAVAKYCTSVFRCWMVPFGMRRHGNQVCLLFDDKVDTAVSLFLPAKQLYKCTF